jgi:hypothetical protein
MGKNQSASNITNIIRQDASGNIAFMSGSTMLMSLNNTGQMSGSAPAVSAVTASYADNFTVRGSLTAQTLVVQTITSSVDFVTGSTRFGSFLTNTHVFSGSVAMNPGGLFVSGSGNVGIGTTNPATKFDLSGSIGNFQIASSGAEIFLTRNDNNDILATGGSSSGLSIGAQSYVRFYSGTGYTERMRINSSGSVTIGTTSLTGWGANDRVLKIQGSTGISAVQAVSSDAGCAVWLYSGASSSDHPSVIYLKDLRFGSATDLGTGGYNERMRIASSGQVLAPYGYQSFKGSVSIAASATTTIYTMPQASSADGIYYVYCRLNGGAAIYMASAIITALAANNELFISNTRTGANVGLSVSGRDIRITNGGFGTFTWQWSILFQPVD